MNIRGDAAGGRGDDKKGEAMRKQAFRIGAFLVSISALTIASGCGVQQAVDSAIQNGINQAAGQFSGIDVQGFVNSYLQSQGNSQSSGQ